MATTKHDGFIPSDEADKLYSYPTLPKSVFKTLRGDGTYQNMPALFTVCNTAAATAEKACGLSGWDYTGAQLIYVWFGQTNTAANPTLKVGNAAAAPIYYCGKRVTGTQLRQGSWLFIGLGGPPTFEALAGPMGDWISSEATANKATTLETPRTINGAPFDGSSNLMFHASSSTEADEPVKTATMSAFDGPPPGGSLIAFGLVNGNTADDVQISINGEDPLPLYRGMTQVKGNFQYEARGTFLIVKISSSNCYRIVEAQPPKRIYTCDTDAATVAKTATGNHWYHLFGNNFYVWFNNENTAKNPTLNINGAGAKALYNSAGTRLTGAALTAGLHHFMYMAPTGTGAYYEIGNR